MYAHSNRASKSMVCILVEEEGDIGNSTFIVDISYVSLGNWYKSRQKKNKDVEDMTTVN